ncbi:MAG TPA: hypothetical protein VNZ52_11810, partial [Candidatus Thermoplasmatota archaeon]|nr:hypothetical protein [Candidatus Thermoplasmatota archaeon]
MEPETVQVLNRLETEAPALSRELRRLLVAFLEASDATASLGDAPREAEVNRYLEARATILDAAHGLAQASTTASMEGFPFVGIGGVLALDLSGEATTYTRDYILAVDLGGDDRYVNNAGGSSWNTLSDRPCRHWEEVTWRASALVDLRGNDTYGDPKHPRLCGVNGGAAKGTGILIDLAGNDLYHGSIMGVNGGAWVGMGFLYDAAGNDLYSAGSNGVNGGADGNLAGVYLGFARGELLDLSGNDTYRGY